MRISITTYFHDTFWWKMAPRSIIIVGAIIRCSPRRWTLGINHESKRLFKRERSYLMNSPSRTFPQVEVATNAKHATTLSSSSIVVPRRVCFTSQSSSAHPEDEHDATDNNSLQDGSTSSSVINVSELSDEMRLTVRSYTRHFVGDYKIRLVGILAQDGPFREDAELYSDCIARTCQEDGIDYELIKVSSSKSGHSSSSSSSSTDLEEAIVHANHRSDVHGILVYYPIFKTRIKDLHQSSQHHRRGPYKNQLTGVYYKTFDDYLRDKVCPTKDVEGLCHEYNARWLFRARGMNRINTNGNYFQQLRDDNNNDDNDDDDILYPCTALSVMKILERYHHHHQQHQHPQQQQSMWSNNCVVTIVNRSEIFGRPLAAMLALQGATVYSVDADSILLFRPGGRMSRCSSSSSSSAEGEQAISLHTCLEQSSIVVTGVPSSDYCIPCESIRPGGTTLVNVSEYPNVRDTDELLAIPGLHYIPHVGKVTVAALELNLIQLHRRSKKRINNNNDS